MAPRDRLPRVRDVVELATLPLRHSSLRAASLRAADVVRPDDDEEASPDARAARTARSRADERFADRREELEALREAEERLGPGGDRADRATRSAEAYLAARRRRLRRQLDGSQRSA